MADVHEWRPLWRLRGRFEILHAHVSDPRAGGGRSNGNRFRGALDYWRVSNEVLEPSQFLCADGAGTVSPPPSPTKFYWKLGRTPTGQLDVSSQIGRSPLHGGFPEKGISTTGRFVASTDRAFEGIHPPNSTVTLPRANSGSFYAPAKGHYWRFADLGALLEVTNSFTVEGWFKPERHENDDDAVEYLFNTRISEFGWALGLQHPKSGNNQSWRLQIFAQMTNGVSLVNNANLSGDLGDWTDWKHLALVYDHTAAEGRGVWTAFLDGARCGCATNAVLPEFNTASSYFHFGGRKDNSASFRGRVDCVRVTKGALNPNQFLCASGEPKSVSDADILGFWPLDVADGVYCVSEDLAGTNPIVSEFPTRQKVGVTTDAPVIPNPDRTSAFAGSPTNLTGSAAFNCAANNNAANSYLLSYDPAVIEAFRGMRGWTAECYFKRSAPVSNWEILFGLSSDLTTTAAGMALNMTYRSNGYVLLDNMHSQGLNGDFVFPHSAADTPTGEWTHFALTCAYREIEGVTNIVMEVFINGQSKGTLERASYWNPPHTPSVFMIGGRYHSGNSFKGQISSFRISDRPLEPSEFLCASGTPYVETEPSTVAYWPLDSVEGAVDAGSRVLPGAGFAEVVDVTGTSETARARVPRADASPDFAGDPKANQGSLTISESGRLSVGALGFHAERREPFTVEGWIKWQGGESNPKHVLVGTYRPARGCGWKLFVDGTGAKPSLWIYATPGHPYSPIVNTRLLDDISSWQGVWQHVALSYAPHVGDTKGVWTLWVNGKVAAAVENLWAPQEHVFGSPLFGLGKIPSGLSDGWGTMAGTYDLWRLSKGALGAEQLLYKMADGTLVILK